jgi:hypothetical protein
LVLLQDDDEISSQYQTRKEQKDRDTISQMSIDSCDSREPVFVVAGDIRRRLSESINAPQAKHGFKRDPEDPSASILKEPWHEKGDSNTMLENREYEVCSMVESDLLFFQEFRSFWAFRIRIRNYLLGSGWILSSTSKKVENNLHFNSLVTS